MSRPIIAPVWVLAGLLPLAQAVAQPASLPDAPVTVGQDRTVMLILGGSVTRDSNVLRLSSADDPEVLLGTSDTSDTVSTAQVGIAFDKTYSQQRFLGRVSRTAYRYDKFDFLDFDGTDYRAAWQWHLSPRISGTLSADQSESLVNYADFRSTTERNVVTTQNRLLSANGLIGAGWYVVGAASEFESKNSAAFAEKPSSRAKGGEGGIRYQSTSDRWVTVNYRSLDGDYINQVVDPVAISDDGFRRIEKELLAYWSLTGKSALDVRIAEIDYRSNNFSQRDFSGTAGRAVFRWTPAAKLALGFLAGRELSPWTADFASYRVDDSLGVLSTWEASARLLLGFAFQQTVTNYRQPLPTFTGEARHDRLNAARATLDWRVLRNLTLSAGVQREQRDSNDPTGQYDTTSYKASVAFQL